MEINRETEQKAGKKRGWIVRWTACILAALFAVILIGEVFKDKSGHNLVDTFYDEPKNSIDVVFLGTSRGNQAFIPMLLWEKYGIASYNMCNSAQNLCVASYYLEEAIRMQDPKVVVLDFCQAFQSSKYMSNTGYLHNNLDNLQWSSVKLRAIRDCVKPEERMAYYWPITAFHERWKALNKEDFLRTEDARRGCALTLTAGAGTMPGIVSTDKTIKLSNDTKEYLLRIIDLCEENGIELILTLIPFDAENTGYPISAEDQLAYYNAVRQVAEERGITYLDLMEKVEEIGFDYPVDLYNGSHMNYLGGVKISNWLADYLHKHYDLPDHRGEAAYDRWEKDLSKWRQSVARAKSISLAGWNDLTQYLGLTLEENDFLVLMAIEGNQDRKLPEVAASLMRSVGLETDLSDTKGQGWIGVLERGNVVYEGVEPKLLVYEETLGDLPLKIYSNVYGSYCHILVNEKAVGRNRGGLNIVVYSLSQKKVVDSVAFDISSEACTAFR